MKQTRVFVVPVLLGIIFGLTFQLHVYASVTEPPPPPPPNDPPNTPSRPSGPSSGYVDTSYTYSTSATDPDGDDVKYRFDWGDGNISGWTSLVPSGSSASKSHSWSSAGTYYVKAQARDEHGATSDWSSSKTVVISQSNNPPNTPSKPSGPSSGYVDTSYTYSTSATDPDGDDVKYRFDWGDGNISGWTSLVPSGSSASKSHSWSSAGTYYVKAQARDEHGATSDWSSSKTVVIEDPQGAMYFEIYPSADSFTDLRDNPDGNYGSQNWIGVNRATKSGVWPSGLGEGTFLKFDLSGIPTGTKISSVTFYAYAYAIWYNTTCDSCLREFGTNWSEDTITGNNAPWNTLGGQVSDTVRGSIPDWWAYNVDRDYIQGKLGGEVGFYLCYPGTASGTHYGQYYYSKEYTGTYLPFLRVLVDDDGIREVGVWWGEDYCWPNPDLPNSQEDAEGFLNELVSVGFTGVHNFGDDSAREKHFEMPGHWVGNDGDYGQDYNYVDSVDLAWWTGHGEPGKIWLTEDPAFWPRTVDESEVEWGDVDLEWAILCGCEILRGDECQESEWGNAFNRLHGLCGFHTTSYNVDDRGSTFAEYLTGQKWPYVPLTIKEAWKKTTEDTQPSGVWGSIYAGAYTGGPELAYEYLHGYETGMFSDPDYNDPDWYKINYQWIV